MNNITIVAVATGYPYSIYRNFLSSLYSTDYNGQCIVLVNQTDLEKVSEFKKTQFVAIEKYVPKNCDMHIQNHRYAIYKRVIEESDILGDYIFFTDFADVLFQKNIANYPLDDHDIYLFEEEQIIKNCSFNNFQFNHIKHTIDADINYDNRTIICSGTILIKTKIAQKFLIEYYNFIMRYLSTVDKSVNNQIIADQAALNYMYHMNYLDEYNIKTLNNLDNMVNTMHWALHPYIMNSRVKDGYIVNMENEISYIAHQYNRLSSAQIDSLQMLK